MSLRLGILAIVANAFLSLAGAMLWYRGQATAAEADRARAIADLNTAVAANQAQQETIGRLRASAEANDDRIIVEMADRLAEIGQAVTETNQAVGDLKDATEDVRGFSLLSLPICACSWTAKRAVVSMPVVVRESVPAALVRPCPPKSRKPLATTGDLVNRLTYIEGALATCSAQVDGIRKWNGGAK